MELKGNAEHLTKMLNMSIAISQSILRIAVEIQQKTFTRAKANALSRGSYKIRSVLLGYPGLDMAMVDTYLYPLIGELVENFIMAKAAMYSVRAISDEKLFYELVDFSDRVVSVVTIESMARFNGLEYVVTQFVKNPNDSY